MQNQESPQTDQDVIDWLVESLSGQSRGRRGVIKKLKDLGLIFKVPTKRSNAAAVNKNLFMSEEDEKLRELYDEHRAEKDCLKRIMEVFNKKRSKKVVVRRMVQLGIIADESEILPASRKQKNRMEHERERLSGPSDSSSDDDERPEPAPKRSADFKMNQAEAKSLRTELEESLKEAIEWIIESLKEAAEDFEDTSEDLDDAIPIVPFTESQKAALENEQFKKLLASINLQAPQELETYWKIPANMLPKELNLRVKLLAGEEVSEESTLNTYSSEDENDDDEDLFARLRAQRETLMYNRSDDENKRSVSAEKVQQKKVDKVGKPNTKMIQQVLASVAEVHGDALKWIVGTLRDKATNKSSSAIDEMLLMPSKESHKSALHDGSLVKLLMAINLSPPNGAESFWQIPKALSSTELVKRAELLEVPSDSSDDDEQQMIIKRKKKKETGDSLEINTQELKQRLADLDSSSDESSRNNSIQKQKKKKVLESSDEDEVMNSIEKVKSGKRDRSEIQDDENEMNATNKSKRIRKIVDSSEDEE